jgi:YHS domain-containing protein
VQGPEIWLKQLGISVACVVDPNQPGILDEACRVFVNYETYYLSSAEATGKFNQAPWRFTGLVTDPVTHQRFQPTSKSPSQKFEGRLYYFSSAISDQTVEGDPAAYATPVVPYAGSM